MESSLNTERKNGVILTKKVESLAEVKFDPGFRVIGEYLSQIESILGIKLIIDIVNQIDIENQIDNQFNSNILQLLEIPGRILVPPVTQLYRSK